MALFHIPFDIIDEKHLEQLIKAKAAEARDIEYKRSMYGPADADIAECLADLASFANTTGGDLLIGIDAKKGVPEAVVPMTASFDADILRIEEIARSGLQPRLASLRTKAIPLAAGGYVLLVRVPRSYNPPHRQIRKGTGELRFWARGSNGKYQPDVDELRALFTLAPQLTDRIRDFRADRVAKITAVAAPVTLMDQACLIMHVVPFSSFDPAAVLPLAQIDKNPHQFAPLGSSNASHWNVNFDGILLKSNADQAATAHRAYTQLYRSGRIETVTSRITAGERPDGTPPRLTSIRIEGQVLLSLVRYVKALQALGVEPPYAVMISIIGIKGVHMNVGVRTQWFDDDDIGVITQEQFHFGEVILDTVPNSIQECATLIRPFIEQLANTAGRAASSSFGPNGEYLHAFQ